MITWRYTSILHRKMATRLCIRHRGMAVTWWCLIHHREWLGKCCGEGSSGSNPLTLALEVRWGVEKCGGEGRTGGHPVTS